MPRPARNSTGQTVRAVIATVRLWLADPQNGRQTKIAAGVLVGMAAIAVGIALISGTGTPPPVGSYPPSVPGNFSVKPLPPASLAGRPRLADDKAPDHARSLKEALVEHVLRRRNTVASFYGSPQGQDLVLVMRTPTPVAGSERHMQRMLDELQSGLGGQVTGMTPIEEGQLGNIAQCGTLNLDSGAVAICVWMDNRSVGIVIWLMQRPVDARAELTEIRTATGQASSAPTKARP